MDSSGNDSGGVESIGESVGGLVWVRRRNGSWWPGRIMKPDELPDNAAVPVRSSTPVRLLGHGDNCVDWYNLERSKRVKPFRCGEYDVYIEKAKATAGTIRQTEKYVRRSDAILEALQIENACLGRDPLEFCSRVIKLGGRRCSKSARKPPSISHDIQADVYKGGENSDSEDSTDSLTDLSQYKETCHGRDLKVAPMKGKRHRTPNDSVDDLAEGYKRMKGLEDLGAGVVSGKIPVVEGGVGLVHRGSSSLFDSTTGYLMANGIPVDSSGSFQSSRKRRSPVAHGHETSKRKDRRRPLTKVLEETAMVALPTTCARFASSSSIAPQKLADVNYASEQRFDGSRSPSMMKGAKISILPVVAENESSDSLDDTLFFREEKYSAGIRSCFSGEPQVGVVGRHDSENCQTGAKSLKIEGANDSVLTNSADLSIISQQIDEGTSKWQSKGKRNSRHISKDMKSRSDKYMDIDEDDADMASVELSDEFSLGLVGKVDYSGMVGSLAAHNSGIVVESSENQCERFQNWRTQLSGRGSQMREAAFIVQPPVQDPLPPQRLLPYRQSRMKVPSRYRDPDSTTMDFQSSSQLVDVYVRVDSHYQRQHPLVSLTSHFNGDSIIGHPLTVDILDDSLSSKPGRTESDATILPGRVDANIGYAVDPLSEAENNSKRVSTLMQHRSNYTLPKHRKSGLQPKTRKLSSLSSRKVGYERNPLLVKCESPAIACVPAKVVFSRISGALKGPPRQTQARNTAVYRSLGSAYVNIIESGNRPAGPAVQESIKEAMSRSPKPAQANIIEAVNRSQRVPERIVYPRMIEAVSGSPTPAQHA